MDKDPTEILEGLALLQCDEAPTLGYLLTKCPNLADSDWVNRWGPIDSWKPILSKFSTSQLAYLAKALTVIERDLNWIGGSVGAAIWIFRAYQAREDGDAEALADWILSNGSNPWSPFGTRSSARSLNDYHREREWRSQQRITHLEREAAQRRQREDERQQAQERALLRRASGEARAVRLKALLKDLDAMDVHDRLPLLAVDETIPLEAVPENIITLSLPVLPELSAEIHAKLLVRLDGRKARRWRKLRKALREQPLIESAPVAPACDIVAKLEKKSSCDKNEEPSRSVEYPTDTG